jgi:hypothetical protein
MRVSGASGGRNPYPFVSKKAAGFSACRFRFPVE